MEFFPHKDCIIVYRNGKSIRLRATSVPVGDAIATVYENGSVMAVVPLDLIKTILFCDIADAQTIVDAINGVDDEEESGGSESDPPYKEKNTQCDDCPHLQECIESGNVLDATSYYDSRKHYIKAIGSDCCVMGEYFYSHEIAREARE